MQRDEEELPPNELDLSRMESPQPESEFEELADLPPGETVNAGEAEASETDASDATDLDDADGTAAIRAIEDSLASTEGESPAFAAIALPSPGVNDSSEVKAPEESAEPSVSLDAEWNAGAAAPALLPVKWSPFMQLVLGNTPPPRGMEEGDVEQPWSSVNPPTAAETARHSPMLAIERKGGRWAGNLGLRASSPFGRRDTPRGRVDGSRGSEQEPASNRSRRQTRV